MLFVGGAVLLDVLPDESDAEAESVTTETTREATTPIETTPAGGDGSVSPSLPKAYVVTRTRDNPTILSNDYVELVSLALAPGSYQVFGKLSLTNRDGRRPFTVECTLVPSDRDGTRRPLGRAGDLGSDYGDLTLGPYDAAGGRGSISFAISQVLDTRGTVWLGCRGFGHEHGAFGGGASIRAIRVGSIESTEYVP